MDVVLMGIWLDVDVERMNYAMTEFKPQFLSFVKGRLYAVGSPRSYTVNIPYDTGTFAPRSMNHIVPGLWMGFSKMMEYLNDVDVLDLAPSRHTVSGFPGLYSHTFRHAYTFIFDDTPSALLNLLVRRLTDYWSDWMGNIIVVKHRIGSDCVLEDITEYDVRLVEELLIGCLVGKTFEPRYVAV
ncbi:hypothetical protein JAAARDRAFT_198651 [Jaapia argillacea MUCL 33604]|uniref:Uncharacterized protein n=1 Tax=Jaapia argillacea MUCL 33604 TaxID=933084 RepID=A0A067PAS0_9AGAM|nr:hypothetical protein JAAARDRAFT_198651 [Jaapia argillacea MUCL 33604]